MKKSINWSERGGSDARLIRRLMSNFSLIVREKQYMLFEKLLTPSPSDNVLDVGTSTDETLIDTNFFEKRYPYKQNITIASVEKSAHLVKKYGLRKFIVIAADKSLPFADKSFDLVVSWATVEHVGTRIQQERFLKELIRVGKKVFITTPDRLSLYEPHSATFFLHYLPVYWFRTLIKKLGKSFWSVEKNLNILSLDEVKRMLYNSSVSIIRFKIFGVLPSHIIIYGKQKK